MNRSLLVLPIALIFALPAEAFLPGKLTKEEEQTCQRRAARSKNSFSAKQTYYECKKTIKKENENKIKRQKWLSCYQRELKSNEIASAEEYRNIRLMLKKIREKYELINSKDKKNNEVISEHPFGQQPELELPTKTNGTWKNPGPTMDEVFESNEYLAKKYSLKEQNERLARKACEKYD